MNRTDARDLAVTQSPSLTVSTSLTNIQLNCRAACKAGCLAQAIADKPEILLFDEPTSGLDPITGGVIDRLIIDAVKRLVQQLTISHDMASVRRIADKVAMIHNGVIIWCGPVAEMDETCSEVDQFVHGRAEGPLTLPPRRGTARIMAKTSAVCLSGMRRHAS